MQSEEIRNKFLKFFEKRGHVIIPSASLVPENDPSVLFNTAGMQPFVPYLLGEKHPAGTRIADVQKCVRTTDIDEVGDNTHLTFFEMLGNWSLGDYFKKEAIQWSYEFLTDKKKGLGLDPSRLYVTVFGGNKDVPEKDEESYNIWEKIFEKEGLNHKDHVFFMEGSSNWWSPGDNGPCGSDSEMFYDVTGELTEGMTKEEFIKADDEQKVVEVWNDVFMEYEKKDGKVIGKLAQKNVDTGAGLERLAVMMQGKNNVFETDLFEGLMGKIRDLGKYSTAQRVEPLVLKSERIIADHVRAAVFIISDGVVPANTDRGYILRRIIRRVVRHMDLLGIEKGSFVDLANVVIEQYGDIYKNVKENADLIRSETEKEEEKFRKTLMAGLKQLRKISGTQLSLVAEGEKFPKYINAKYSKGVGKILFDLFQTYGFPIEMSLEELNNILDNTAGVFEPLSEKREVEIKKEFEEEMKKHQELSRTASVGKFKGGLGGHDENSTKLHTATHLLHQALREVLGDHVEQKGSNINPERLRFDFSHSEKMTDEEKQKVEDIVNEKIRESLPVEMEEMTVEKAKEKGAIGVFGDKYGKKVKVYSIGDFSKEICGGPHIKNTSELGIFKIKKEEASSACVRRIKAVLE
jgi:alanyl-tRNA synthetase